MRNSSLTLTLLCSCALASVAYAQQPNSQHTAQPNPPANICVELSSFLDQTQKTSASQPPTSAAGTPQAANAGQQASAPQQGGQSGDKATAVEGPSRSGASLPSSQGESQRTSGMSGPVPEGGPGAAGPQGNAQETSKSGQVNPKPDGAKPAAQAAQKPAEAKAPPPDRRAVDKGRQAAGSNDLDGCSGVVRDMRLAGVALPNPLIALAALKPELRAKAPQGPAPGVPLIPPSGIEPQEGGAGAPQERAAEPPAR